MAKQILKYLQSHPQASDTLEGIAKWWVMSQQLSELVLTVKQALDLLKAEGYVLEKRGPDGRILYAAGVLT